jgi:hypothetical protein
MEQSLLDLIPNRLLLAKLKSSSLQITNTNSNSDLFVHQVYSAKQKK